MANSSTAHSRCTKGKYNGTKGKDKGERVVTISNGSDPRQQRASEGRSVVKEKMQEADAG